MAERITRGAPAHSSAVAQKTARLRTDAGRRRAKAAAEHAVEVGDIAETTIIGDGAYLAPITARIVEYAIRLHQALIEDIFSKGGAGSFKQPLDGTRRTTVLVGEGSHRQTRPRQIVGDVLLDGAEPCSGQSAVLCLLGCGPSWGKTLQHDAAAQ